jgi:hypothetical protein
MAFKIPSDIQKMTLELNFRTIIFDGNTFQAILSEEKLENMAFTVMEYKKRGSPKSILTLHYALFDKNGEPFFFDGSDLTNTTSKNWVTNFFKKNRKFGYGIQKDDLKNTITIDSPKDTVLCVYYQDLEQDQVWVQLEKIVKFDEGGGAPGGDKTKTPYP